MKSVLLFRYMQIYSDLWSTLDIAVCVHTYLFFVWCFFLCFFYWINLLFAICFWANLPCCRRLVRGRRRLEGRGWGFVKETGPQESFLFRRETGVDGVGTRLSFAAKTSHVLLGPRESPPPNLLRVAGTTWAGLIRKVHMLRLVVFSKNRKAVPDASFTAGRRIAGSICLWMS